MRLLPLAALLLIPTTATAQDAPPPATSPAPRPDIEFSASVHVDSIEFTGAPRASVRFTGGPRVQTRHDVERDGLPRPVPAGRTFRDVTVHATIGATLLDPALDADASTPAPPPPSSPTTDEDSP